MPHAAICIGHSRPGDQGAHSLDHVSEWEYNRPLGRLVADRLRSLGHTATLHDRYQGASYGSAINWLAERLREQGADCAIELHFNAAGPSAEGHEYLYWHASARGEALARQLALYHPLRNTPRGDDGVKPLAGDRGSGFLSKTHCPAVICEPFFGTNPADWRRGLNGRDALAEAYADALHSWMADLSTDPRDPAPDPDPEPTYHPSEDLHNIQTALTRLRDHLL